MIEMGLIVTSSRWARRWFGRRRAVGAVALAE
jgi:hypothetical protein